MYCNILLDYRRKFVVQITTILRQTNSHRKVEMLITQTFTLIQEKLQITIHQALTRALIIYELISTPILTWLRQNFRTRTSTKKQMRTTTFTTIAEGVVVDTKIYSLTHTKFECIAHTITNCTILLRHYF